MRNDHVIPCVAILMAKHNEVCWHRRVGIRRLQPIAQLHRFAESSLGEVDVINISSFTSPGWRRSLFTCSGLWRALALNKCNRQQAK